MLNIKKDKINIYKTRTTFGADLIRRVLYLCNITDVQIIDKNYNLLKQHLYVLCKGDVIIFISDYKVSMAEHNITTINYTLFNDDSTMGVYINGKKHALSDAKNYAIKYRRLNQLKSLME